MPVMTPDSQQSLPSLKRSLGSYLHQWTNRAFGSPPQSIPTQESSNGDEPRKRRRVSSPERLLPIDHLIASPRGSESGQQTLRIEVLKLTHKDAKKVRPKFGQVVTPDTTLEAMCRIIVLDLSLGRERTRHHDSQRCQIVTYKNPVGTHQVARIHMDRPFYIQRDKLMATQLHDNFTHELSDAYRLVIVLESVQSSFWPPLTCHDLNIDQKYSDHPTRHLLALESSFNEIFGRLRAPIIVKDTAFAHEPSVPTNYELDVDLRWTSGFQALRRLDAGSKPCITAFDPENPARVTTTQLNGSLNSVNDPLLDEVAEVNGIGGLHEVNGVNGRSGTNAVSEVDGASMNGINGVNGVHDANDRLLSPEPTDDLLNGDLTPSRSLRTRGGEKNYNLKALSDQAHGRQRKRRKQNAPAAASEGQVRYFLPPEQPLCLDGFRCVACGAFHPSLQLLQLHLETHLDHEYTLEQTSQGLQFHVKPRRLEELSPSKTLNLARPTKEFNLESYLAGDQGGWLQSRLGPESKDDFMGAVGAPIPPAAAAAVRVPRLTKQASSIPKVKAPPVVTKTYIPESKNTFFHPVSKQTLKAGDEVPYAPAEKTWLYHRHQESLNESQDLTPAQLEYIKEFDKSMRNHDISARAYFPRAWLDFVRSRASWLIEAKYRMIEFSLHESYLLASKLLRDEHLDEAVGFLEDARREKHRQTPQSQSGDVPQKKSPKPTPRTPPIRESAKGCGVCRMPVLCGPELLICDNPECDQRLFHFNCVGDAPSGINKSKWLCKECVADESS